METTMINHPKLKVHKRTGHEGPHYDPYSFEELTITTPERTIIVHLGLAVWVKVGDLQIDAHGVNYDNCFEWIDRFLNKYVGYTQKQLYRFYTKASSRCPTGGYHDTVALGGYPGEEFEVCRKCSRTVSYNFCESAIM